MAITYIAFGSNIEPRRTYIEKALDLLESFSVKILEKSYLMETDPVGGPENQGMFLNGVVKAETELSPHELLIKINEIEKELGRIREMKDGPRTIDLDILLYDELVINDEKLTIPHSKMWERDFVMKPLKEIFSENLDHFRSQLTQK